MIRISDGCAGKPLAIVLGNFDGVHIGHQLLIKAAKDYALKNGLSTAVLSFSPHPVIILRNPEFQTLMTPEEKAYFLEYLKVDYLIEYPFDLQFAETMPYDFVNDILIGKFNCKALFVGESFKCGPSGIGDCNLLGKIGAESGMDVVVIPDLTESTNNEVRKVSSSWIRELVLDGKFDLSARLMGHPYFIIGDVIHSQKLGRTLGFPTANLLPPKGKLLPRDGVYATMIHFDNYSFQGMTNIGSRPTIYDSGERQIETFIFDFSGDIYEKRVRIDFLKWVRDELSFNDIEGLKKQLRLDEEHVRGYLKTLVQS